jgi:hypothetical protein
MMCGIAEREVPEHPKQANRRAFNVHYLNVLTLVQPHQELVLHTNPQPISQLTQQNHRTALNTVSYTSLEVGIGPDAYAHW